MKSRFFKMLLVCLALGLLSLGGPSVPAAAQQVLTFTKVNLDYQVVEVHKADGTISSAEFLSEITLLPDGRANGGFGIWELGAPDVLSLYHVFEGHRSVDRRTGPFYSFRAERLAPLPATEITITLRPVQSHLPTPTGTVKFIITLELVDNSSIALLSFNANGQVNQGCVGPAPCDGGLPEFGFVRTPPQAVVIQTLQGNYTANVENVALVFSHDRAIGLLSLSGPDGTVHALRVTGGELFLPDAPHAGAIAGLIKSAPPPVQDSLPPLPVVTLITDQGSSIPGLSYDIISPQTGPAHFEVQGRITGIALDPF